MSAIKQESPQYIDCSKASVLIVNMLSFIWLFSMQQSGWIPFANHGWSRQYPLPAQEYHHHEVYKSICAKIVRLSDNESRLFAKFAGTFKLPQHQASICDWSSSVHRRVTAFFQQKWIPLRIITIFVNVWKYRCKDDWKPSVWKYSGIIIHIGGRKWYEYSCLQTTLS